MSLFRPLVLHYHAIADDWDDPLAVRLADFGRQVESLIERGYRGASSADVIRNARRGRLLHVTFDDGFRSVLNGVPLLRRLGVPSTIFICSRLASDDGAPLAISELEHRGGAAELGTLSWQGLRELTSDGMVEIGSHTATHAHLKQLSDEALDRELRSSKADIEEHLGRPCESFAYPYGEHDERVRRRVIEAGYSYAFAAPGDSMRFDPFLIPRTSFWRDEPDKRWRLKTRLGARIAREQIILRRG